MKNMTQAVFKNADPKIQSAAVDSTGEAWAYSCPKSELIKLNTIWAFKARAGVKRWWIGHGFDASDWKNSAIDRIE